MRVGNHQRNEPGSHRRTGRARTLVGALCLGAAAVVPLALGAGAGVAGASLRPLEKNPLHLITPGSLTVVAQSDQLPFDGIENRVEVGFDIALDRAMAKEMGLKITFHDQDFAGILSALDAHEYDFGAMALLALPARAQEVTFTQPFYYGDFSVMVKKSSGLTKVSDFHGKRIGVLLGTDQPTQADGYLGSSISLVTFENENEAMAALQGGQINGVFIGYASSPTYMTRYHDLSTPLFWVDSTPDEIAVAKGDTALARALNRALDGLYSDGTYAKLYHEWIPGPIPQLLIKAHKGFQPTFRRSSEAFRPNYPTGT